MMPILEHVTRVSIHAISSVFCNANKELLRTRLIIYGNRTVLPSSKLQQTNLSITTLVNKYLDLNM